MKKYYDQISTLIISIVALFVCCRIQLNTGQSMAILYGYCIVNIIFDVKDIIRKKKETIK